MINMLVDKLPTSVKIGGVKYDINSNFTTSILFTQLVEDRNLDEEEKLFQALELYYYPQTIPREHLNEAIEQMLWFYRCGKDIKQSKSKGKNQKKLIFSYDDDDEYIVGAFRRDYGLDLDEIKYLHWWKFKALFKSLQDDNELCKIMSYRAKDLSKIKDKDEKIFYKEMQELYKIEESTLEDDLTELEKIKNRNREKMKK